VLVAAAAEVLAGVERRLPFLLLVLLLLVLLLLLLLIREPGELPVKLLTAGHRREVREVRAREPLAGAVFDAAAVDRSGARREPILGRLRRRVTVTLERRVRARVGLRRRLEPAGRSRLLAETVGRQRRLRVTAAVGLGRRLEPVERGLQSALETGRQRERVDRLRRPLADHLLSPDILCRGGAQRQGLRHFDRFEDQKSRSNCVLVN